MGIVYDSLYHFFLTGNFRKLSFNRLLVICHLVYSPKWPQWWGLDQSWSQKPGSQSRILMWGLGTQLFEPSPLLVYALSGSWSQELGPEILTQAFSVTLGPLNCKITYSIMCNTFLCKFIWWAEREREQVSSFRLPTSGSFPQVTVVVAAGPGPGCSQALGAQPRNPTWVEKGIHSLKHHLLPLRMRISRKLEVEANQALNPGTPLIGKISNF